MSADVKQILQENKFLIGKNTNWINYWQDLASFNLPRKAWMDSPKVSGEQIKFNWLYDSTAIRASQKMVSGFHSNLTNQSTKWFGLTLYNRNKMSKPLDIWFKNAVEIMLAVMSQTNLYNVLKEFYLDYGVFGTGSISTMPHKKSKVNYMSIPIQQIQVVEDDEEKVQKVFNNFRLSAMQAYWKWGKNSGKSIMEDYDAGDSKMHNMHDFVHYVGPRLKRNSQMIDTLSMEFESVYINKKDNHLMDESGFKRFPIHVGRFWKDNTDCFGFSPAMNVLADVKLINACVRTWLRRAMKEADPPLSVPSRGHILPLNLNPAAMNYRDPSLIKDTLHAIGVGGGDFSITEKFLEYINHNIEEGFFVDVFQSFSMLSKNMTVPEVQKRISEGMVLLGPVVNQCQHEVLTPLVLNTFFILLDAGMFGKAPAELYENDFGPVYDSPLARAARESEAQNLDGFMARTGPIIQAFPESKSIIDPMKTIRWVAKTMSVPAEILRSDAEVDQIVKMMQKQAMAQQQLNAGEQGAKIVKDGAAAEKHIAHAESLRKAA